MALRRRKYRKRHKVLQESKKIYNLNGSPIHPSQGVFSPTDKNSSTEAGIYHNHLHASLQAFRARKWRPLTPDTVPRPTVTRCRPINARPSSAGQVLVPHPPKEQRPSSSLGVSHSSKNVLSLYPRRPDTPRVTPGNFDTLSPRVLSYLVTDSRPQTPNSSYGDIIHSHRRRKTNKSEPRKKTEAEIFNDSSSAFSGSDDDDDLDDDESNSESSDDESISELERGLEPALDHRRKAPDLQLRPEQLDHVYVPENKRDMRRFDFDAEKTEIPLYDFGCPIPNPLNKINFRLHARENTNWRFSPSNLSSGIENPSLNDMLDRIVELEKRQIETEEWEEKRLKSSKKRAPSRGGSASTRPRDRRCCSSCLQPCCVGDCPNKKTVHPVCCETCHQPLCTGSCSDTRYEQRMRHPRETLVTSLPPRLPHPKNCQTCQRKHRAKFINANQVVLGRPKSAFSTYSRGQKSAKPKDLRPKSAMHIERSISKKIEKLGLDPVQQQTASSPGKPATPPGRNGLLPGKTYFSNLSRSLTDLTSKRRCKSAKMRRLRSSSVKVSKSIPNDV